MYPLLVLNPASSGGRTGRAFPALRPVIERALGPVEVAATERPGHGAEIAREAAAAGRELVIAVGGDGTFSEVVHGVMEAASPRTCVGLIGQGTGGDFRRTLGIEHRLDRYLEALSRPARPVDVGRVRYRGLDGRERTRHFVNVVSVGMSGLVDRYVREATPGSSGSLAYLRASLEAMARAERTSLRCRSRDGAEVEERRLSTWVVAVCNGRYFGGGMEIAPRARIDDGTFDVVSLSATTRTGLVLTTPSLYLGRHLARADVVHFRCRSIDLEPLAPAPAPASAARPSCLLDLDGEALGGPPLSVELLPGALALRG